MSKCVRFKDASEEDLRSEIKNLRAENSRLIKQDQDNKSLIKKLNDDFKAHKAEIKSSSEQKDLVKSMKQEIKDYENNTKLLKQDLVKASHKEIRLRATLELQSTQLVLENVKNKQLILALAEMTKQIEKQGASERERSFLYTQMKNAFVEKWNANKSKAKSSKVSGETVEENIKNLVGRMWRDLPERNSEQEMFLLGKAQDSVVSLVNRAKEIITLLASHHNISSEEEEILITVKRKRGNQSPYYQVSSSGIIIAPAPSAHSPPSPVPTQSPATGLDLDFSDSISKFLSEFRNFSNIFIIASFFVFNQSTSICLQLTVQFLSMPFCIVCLIILC